MNTADTIIALSTSPAAGGRMVLRLSGAEAHRIGGLLREDKGTRGQGDKGKEEGTEARRHEGTEGKSTIGNPQSAMPVRLWPGVSACIYWFVGPHSYTGEDLVELHIPGSPALARMLIDRIVSLGARLAEPGEFTARAYFNGRMDLTQAEGVAALVSAHSRRELLAGRQLLAGELARRLSPVMEDLAQMLALVEAGIDFADEEISFISAREILDRIDAITRSLDDLLRDSASFERLSHEPRIVLAGRPNAGKSTLLNALAGQERAVVSEVAGTTRDALSAEVRLERGMVRVVDVAGLEAEGTEAQRHEGTEGERGKDEGGRSEKREARSEKEDGRGADRLVGEIEAQMRRRALAELEQADLVVVVWAADDVLGAPVFGRGAELVVRTKADAVNEDKGTRGQGDKERAYRSEKREARSEEEGTEARRHEDTKGGTGNWQLATGNSSDSALFVSARTGYGLDRLRERLDRLAFGGEGGELAGGVLALNARHVQAIDVARRALGRAAEALAGGAELAAIEFREALDALGTILGKLTPDDLLGRIFSQFCIGK